MHYQTSIGNPSGPTTLPFFILASAFFTSSLLMQFTSSLTTSASSILGSLLFSFFMSFSKYSFHLFNTASEFTITLPFSFFYNPHMLYIFPCSVSLPSQSIQIIFTFCFQSSIQIVICMSLHHCNCLFCLTLLFFVDLFSIFYFVLCFLCLFLFFYALLNFLIPPPCLSVSFSFPKYHSQYSFSCFF